MVELAATLFVIIVAINVLWIAGVLIAYLFAVFEDMLDQ